MRRFILMIATVCVAVSLQASSMEPQNLKPRYKVEAKDTTRTKVGVMADSLTIKSQRMGRKVAEGTAETIDSIGAAGKRLGKKASVWGDSISTRSRRAIRAWNAGKEEK